MAIFHLEINDFSVITSWGKTMQPFKPIKQARISEVVLGQLKEAILLGQFKSGEKLPSERELTEMFQVSRGVIREAIRVLEVTGFVVTRQGQTGGAYVTNLSFDHLSRAFLDLFLANKLSIPELAKVRNHIEPEIARLAAQHVTNHDAERLMQAQEEEFNEPRNYGDRITRHQRVHLLLAEMCGNHFFEAILRSMLFITREVVEAVEPDHKALHLSGEHAAVIEAVISGDDTRASEAMRVHLDKFCRSLVKMEAAYREKKQPLES
jgi:GntR family transcriptional regulator, transcriptional repressor for pyruvate dehydrogenase complex